MCLRGYQKKIVEKSIEAQAESSCAGSPTDFDESDGITNYVGHM